MLNDRELLTICLLNSHPYPYPHPHRHPYPWCYPYPRFSNVASGQPLWVCCARDYDNRCKKWNVNPYFSVQITLPLNFNLKKDILILPKYNYNELVQNNSLSQFFSCLNLWQFQRVVGKHWRELHLPWEILLLMLTTFLDKIMVFNFSSTQKLSLFF